MAVFLLFVLYLFRAYVVDGERQLLVFVVLVIIMVVQVCALLGRDDSLHQLHGRVVLPAVLAAPGVYGDAFQPPGVRLERYAHLAGRIPAYEYAQGLVAHGADGKVFVVEPLYGETAGGIAGYGFPPAVILQCRMRYGVAALAVNHHPGYHLRANSLRQQ